MVQTHRQYMIPKYGFAGVQSALRAIEEQHRGFVEDGLEYFVFNDSKAYIPARAKTTKQNILNILYSSDFMPRYYNPIIKNLTERKKFRF